MRSKKLTLASSALIALMLFNKSYAVTSTVPVNLTVEAAIIDAVVPQSLSINMASDGTIVTASNAKIVNNSKGPIKVSNVSVTGKSGWSIVDYDGSFSNYPVDSKNLGLEINGDKTKSTGDLTWTGASTMIAGSGGAGASELAIDYKAKLPMQETLVANSNIADVVFTIDWYK